jgi:FixJ family two-component response regulator
LTREHEIVFVVDDDFRIRESLHSLLLPVGFQVATFGSAAEFLDAEKPDRPGCLVLDLKLPKQTAAELGTSEITIRVHRGQIMRKMQAHSLAESIRMADRLGIR